MTEVKVNPKTTLSIVSTVITAGVRATPIPLQVQLVLSKPVLVLSPSFKWIESAVKFGAHVL